MPYFQSLPRVRRIGHYYEQLWHWWFHEGLGETVLEFGLPVRDDSQTLGEIDFLTRANRSSLIHRELSIKFYLCLGSGDQPSDWIGPNAIDRLDLKWSKLHRQLNLLTDTEAGRRHVAKFGPFWTPLIRQLLVQGQLFRHWKSGSRALPAGVNPDHWVGHWCHVSELDQALSELGWCIQSPLRSLHRLHWMAGPDESSLTDRMAVSDKHALRVPCLLSRDVWMPGPEAPNRLFVVADGWPHGALV